MGTVRIGRADPFKPSHAFWMLLMLMLILFLFTEGLLGQTIPVQGASDKSTTALDNSNMTSLPSEIVVHQNYPNPFTNTTTIKFENTSVAQVRLAIYDQYGDLVKAYVYDSLQPGAHEVILDGSNLESGKYSYRFTSGTYSQVFIMNLIK